MTEPPSAKRAKLNPDAPAPATSAIPPADVSGADATPPATFVHHPHANVPGSLNDTSQRPPSDAAPAAGSRPGRQAALRRALRRIRAHLEASPQAVPTAAAAAKLTSGVSFVLESESRQVGAPAGVPFLPHLVIRPSHLEELQGDDSGVAALVDMWEGTATTATVLPIQDEGAMKAYLLRPAHRAALLREHGGLVQLLEGAVALPALLQDRHFLCLHYKLATGADGGVAVEPCAAVPAAPAAPADGEHVSPSGNGRSKSGAWGIADSDIQIGVMVRKGVGGTCPLRAAARQLAASGDLAALLLDNGEAALAVLTDHNTPFLAPAASLSATPSLPTPTKADTFAPRSGILRQQETEAHPQLAEVQTAGQAAAGGAASLQHLSHKPPLLAVAAAICSAESLDAAAPVAAPLLPLPLPTAAAPSVGREELEGEEAAVPLEQRLSMYTLSVRLEVYVAQAVWDMLDTRARCVLFTAIRRVERTLSRLCVQQSRARLLRWCTRLQAALETSDVAQGCTLPGPVSPCAAVAGAATTADPLSCTTAADDEVCGSGSDAALPQPEADASDEELEPGELPNEAAIDDEGAVAATPERPASLLPLCARPASGAAASAGCPPPSEESRAYDAGAVGSSTLDLPLDDSSATALAAACALAAPPGGKAAASQFPWPLYLIATRDSFSHLLIPVHTTLRAPHGGAVVKTEWFFAATDAPANYAAQILAQQQGTAAAAAPGTHGEYGVQQGITAAAATPGTAGAQPSDNAEAVASVLHDVVLRVAAAAGPGASTFAGPSGLLPAGVTTYSGVLPASELEVVEADCDGLDAAARGGALPPSCFQASYTLGGTLKRTKFFFGARYLWTHEQMAAADAGVARGVRVDVPTAPKWVKAKVEGALVSSSILPPGFIDSWALNLYHTGTSGIGAHFDDARRFAQPIYSLRVFSDSRLSFGTSAFGTNGAFSVPMPRGCVTVMEAGGYAANAVKHCVRPSDMAGKSASVIMRRINPDAMQQARAHHLQDTTEMMRCLSLEHSLLSAADAAGAGATPALQQRAPSDVRRRLFPLRHVSAATRRDVARVVNGLVTAVESAVAAEARDATATKLVLCRAVAQVEWAERIGVDLSASRDAPDVLSVLSGLVAWCERPGAAAPAAPPPPLPGAGRGRGGWRPYAAAARGAGQFPSFRPAGGGIRKPGYPPHRSALMVPPFSKSGQYRPPVPVLPVLPPQLVMLAQLVAAEALAGKPLAAAGAAAQGAGARVGVDVAAATQVVLRNLRLPNTLALRQFLLAYAAAAAPRPGGGAAPAQPRPAAQHPQLLTPLQQHAVVLCVARAFCAAPPPPPPAVAAARIEPKPHSACTKL